MKSKNIPADIRAKSIKEAQNEIKEIIEKLCNKNDLDEEEINKKLNDKTLAIIELREVYKRDKTWSFWKVSTHNFEDCTKKSWDNFTINIPGHLKHVDCKNMPYQTIDSGLFYRKIIDKIKQNTNIYFFKNIK